MQLNKQMESKNNEKILHWNETKGRLKRKCSLRKTKLKKLMRVRDMLKRTYKLKNPGEIY